MMRFDNFTIKVQEALVAAQYRQFSELIFSLGFNGEHLKQNFLLFKTCRFPFSS